MKLVKRGPNASRLAEKAIKKPAEEDEDSGSEEEEEYEIEEVLDAKRGHFPDVSVGFGA